MEFIKFGRYSLHFFSNKWFLNKAGKLYELNVTLENYLIFLPILEISPETFIQRHDDFIKKYSEAANFPIRSILNFAIKNHTPYWMKLTLNWLGCISLNYELISTIKSVINNIPSKE